MKSHTLYRAFILCITLAFSSFLLTEAQAAGTPTIDGLISEGEYSNSVDFDKGNFRLLWRIDQDRLDMAIDAKAAGWVSIGFDPTSIMANSDMIFCIIGSDGRLQAIDAWSSGPFGPHPADTDQGGKNSLLASAARRSGDRVVFEFSRLLETGDKLDKPIPKSGKLKVIWAYSSSLAFNSKHQKAGSAVLDLGAAK